MSLSVKWWAGWGLLLTVPLVALVILNRVPSWDPAWMKPTFHFYVVSGTALAAAVACGLVVGYARSLRETRLVFLALAFLSIASIFSVHGLTTPGFIHHEAYPAVAVSAWLSLLVGALFITASAAEPSDRIGRISPFGATIVVGTVIALAGYMYASLFISESEWLSFVPIDNRSFQLAVTTVIIGLLVFSARRYLQAFLFARLPSQWAMVVALVLLVEVQTMLTWGHLWHVSWWMYHALYAGAFVVLFSGWIIEALRAGNLAVIAEGLSMRDALAQLSRGHPQPITDLADAIEMKDRATLGHVSRVANYALIIGRELGLSASQLRSLAMAAQMHDVGKIGTPDRILCKPGPLTDEEYTIIKRHPARGYEIARQVGVLRPVADAIRHHHERIDGRGYPDGLSGQEIPLHSRIIAVADTFDALTSGRPYRDARGYAEALNELRRVSGSQLDRVCVSAFVATRSRLAKAA